MLRFFKEIISYKNFIFIFYLNSIKSKFSNNNLGYLWIIINPLVQVMIYALILSSVMKIKFSQIENEYAYIIYLLSGILCWTLFYSLTTNIMNVFFQNKNLVKKINFPKHTLYFTSILGSLVDFILLLTLVLLSFIYLNHPINLKIIYLIPVTFVLIIFSASFGIMLSVLAIFIKDLYHAIPIILNLLFWLTPIVYPLDIIPANYQGYFFMNPIFHFASIYQELILYGKTPSIKLFSTILIISLMFLSISIALYKKFEEVIADYI